MPLPVIDNTFRVTINWNQVGALAPRNVMHVQADTDDESEVGTAFLDAFEAARETDEPWTWLHNDFFTTQVTVLALDGSSAGVTVTEPDDGQPGQATGDPVPAVAGIVKFRTALRGPSHRGRIFIGPCGESVIEYGQLTTASVAATQSAWEAVITELLARELFPVVASYAHATAEPITSIVAEQASSTQRRRQRPFR